MKKLRGTVMADQLTLQQLTKALPANLKNSASQEMVDMVNNATTDPILAESIRDNFINYTGVLQNGKFKTKDYLKAVMYVSFKLMGNTNQEAYFKTFPDRYQILVAKGTSSKDIAAYVSAYNKNKLVNLILEQSLVPTWVLNQAVYQKAINQQAHLMMNAESEFVQQQAANSILTHLAKPKEVGPLINLDMRESSGMNELKDMLGDLARMQVSKINSGVPTQAIAGQELVINESDEE